MRAVILAGGEGTRLRPYTTVLPKPLVPVGERPILELVVHQLARAGFNRVDLCVGHLGELIRAYFTESDALPEGMEIDYHWEEHPLGTAGAIRQVEGLDEPFLVMNGDILTDLDYRALMQAHAEGGAALTIAAHHEDVTLSLGVIESSGEDVTGYVEKPTVSYEVSMGIYAYDPRALEQMLPGRFDFPDLVLRLVDAGESVRVHRFGGAWFDIGTAGQHERAVAAYESEPHRFDS